VWHGEECFFVSTIDRDSSAMLGPRRFSETKVWRFDWNADEKGEELLTIGGSAGNIHQHIDLCQAIYKGGCPSDGTEDEELI
jgi:hypothetical protein